MTDVTVTYQGSQWTLFADDQFTFGRNASCDLVLSDWASMSRRAGVVIVDDDGWSIANLGSHLDITIREVDGAGVLVQKAGDRVPRRVPFTAASVELPSRDEAFAFTVLCERDQPSGLAPFNEADGDTATRPAWKFAKETKRFAALVALCEPQLLDPQSTTIPTYAMVAARVNRALGGRWDGDKAYEQLRGVARRLGLWEGGGAGTEDRNARQTLVSFAIHSGIVRERDLSRLERDPVPADTGALAEENDHG